MKRIAVLLLVLFTLPALAEEITLTPFEERVWLAKAAESDQRFHPYPSLMYRGAGRHLARTMRHCIAVSPKPKAKSFVLVADIRADGRPDAVEVKPESAVSRCFASGFSSASYLKPPQYDGRPGFPVTMKISVVR